MKMLAPLCTCIQVVNLETDDKTLYRSLLKLKYSPIYLKHKKDLNKCASQKSHEQDLLPKNLQIDRSYFA